MRIQDWLKCAISRLPLLVMAGVVLGIGWTARANGQGGAVKNPLAGNPAAIREGASLFRANCSPCHGLNAKGGGKGPDLSSGRWTHGGSDEAIFRTISRGVPGTEMPANSFEDSETWAITSYLRSLSPPARPLVSGNRAEGEKFFWGRGGCSGCHMANGSGGLLGPELSRVGAARSVSYLIDSIRDPDKDLSDGMSDPNNHYGVPLVYDTVTVVLADGQRITGVAKNSAANEAATISTAIPCWRSTPTPES